jgi:dienelactone hydrolase
MTYDHATKRHFRVGMCVGAGLALLVTLLSDKVSAAELKIDDLVVATSISSAQQEVELKAAKAFYQFWNTGDAALLDAALAPGFVDHTLPPGRPQGPNGPAFASEHFRAAVPDLSVEVRKMIVA